MEQLNYFKCKAATTNGQCGHPKARCATKTLSAIWGRTAPQNEVEEMDSRLGGSWKSSPKSNVQNNQPQSRGCKHKTFSPASDGQEKEKSHPTYKKGARLGNNTWRGGVYYSRSFHQYAEAPPPRLADLNWEALGIAQHDLSDLEAPFTEEEVRKVINQMSSDKAPT